MIEICASELSDPVVLSLIDRAGARDQGEGGGGGGGVA